MLVRIQVLLVMAMALGGCLSENAPEPPADMDPATHEPTPVAHTRNITSQPVVQNRTEDTPPPALATLTLVDTGFKGPEPTIVAASDGTLFLSAVGEVRGGDDYILRSADGLTWTVSYDYPGFGPTNIPNLDPMLEIDPVTDAVYAMAQVNTWCTDLAISHDLGNTWSEARPACMRPPVDHVKLVAAPPGPGGVDLGLHPSVLTLCANTGSGLATSCFVSYDEGTTWPVESEVFNPTTGCSGLVGKPEASASGVLALPAVWNCQHFTVAFSDDNGITWTIERSPLERAHAINPGAGFTPDGTFYGAARAAGEHVEAVRFDGAWHGPWKVTPDDVGSTAFVTAEAGADGHVAVAYLGTRDADVHPTDAPDDARWHLFIAWTTNGADPDPTWTIVQATPDDDPVQVGSICILLRPCSEGNRNLLEFIDSTITPDGRFVVAFADGCTEGCAGNPEATPSDSRDARATVAILTSVDLIP